MSRNNRWLLALFGVFTLALGVSWALIQPPYGLSDEPAHAIKALGTADGQLSGKRTIGQFGYSAMEFEVPTAYTSIWHFTCYSGDVRQTPNCAPPFPDDPNRTITTSTAAEYPPLYYAIVGKLGWISPGEFGLLLMRIATVIICSIFLTLSGYLLIISGNSSRLAALLLCATPTVFAFSGAVNPFAPEVTASILYWTAGTLLLKSDKEKNRSFIVSSYIGAVSFGFIRPASFLWILISMTTILLATTTLKSFRSSVVGRRNLWHFLISSGTGILFSVLWYFGGMKVRSLGAGSPAGGTLLDNMLVSLERTPAYLRQIFGFFGWTTFYAPLLVLSFFMIAILLLFLSSSKFSFRENAVIVCLLLFLLCGPAILEGSRAASSGWGFQGRYLLPVGVGIPILLALMAKPKKNQRVFLLPFSFLIIVGHLVSLSFVTKRFTEGLDGASFWPSNIEWSGGGGPLAIQISSALTLLLGGAFTAVQMRDSADKTLSKNV
jgi:hypothetical protein